MTDNKQNKHGDLKKLTKLFESVVKETSYDAKNHPRVYNNEKTGKWGFVGGDIDDFDTREEAKELGLKPVSPIEVYRNTKGTMGVKEATTYNDEVTTVTAENGTKFNIRILNKGDEYGAYQDGKWAKTWDKDEKGIEFYDAAYDHTPYGQFVSRYYLNTVLGTDEWSLEKDKIANSRGINLQGGVPKWQIDGDALRKALKELGVWNSEVAEGKTWKDSKGHSDIEIQKTNENIAKIACLKCDEVSTASAWKKNDNFCPKCKISYKGVAVDAVEEGKTWKDSKGKKSNKDDWKKERKNKEKSREEVMEDDNAVYTLEAKYKNGDDFFESNLNKYELLESIKDMIESDDFYLTSIKISNYDQV